MRLWFNLTHKTSRKLDFVDFLFVCIASLSILSLVFMIGEISLSDKEARNFFDSQRLFFEFIRWVANTFGQTDYIVKTPILILHFLNLMLLYGICRHTLKHKRDSIIAILIYILLPAVNFSSLLLVESNWIIFITLFIGYITARYNKPPLFLLLFFSFFSPGTLIITLGIALYMLRNKKIKTFLFCSVCIIVNYILYDLDIGGKPQGYILETLGQMAMLYSPLLFVYYVYTIYWGIVQKNNILAYIAGTSIVFCILLSLRQNINFYILIPQSLVGIPILTLCFLNDLRSHLPDFRAKHYMFSSIILLFLLLETLLFFGNKITYFFSQKPNFASSYYFNKEIAKQIKDFNISSIYTQQESLRAPLRFYGINPDKRYHLISTRNKKSDINVSYNGVSIVRYNLKKN